MTKKERINIDEIIGNKYGRLSVTGYVGRNKWRQIILECTCDCGTTKTVLLMCLQSGHTKSCGCLHRESVIKHGDANNSYFHTRLYRIWFAMKSRCYNKNTPSFVNYGGRGITICDEWRNDFLAFREWSLNNGYNDILSIDRIDSNGNYEPDNCQWATNKEQSRNKRNTVFVKYNGVEAPLIEWTERLGLEYRVIYQRIIKLGWDVEKAFSTPKMQFKKHA